MISKTLMNDTIVFLRYVAASSQEELVQEMAQNLLNSYGYELNGSELFEEKT